MKYSANLGVLWKDLKIHQAIYKAKKSNFDAVELWWPYEENPELIKKTAEENELPILCLNAPKGNEENGEFGLNALPDKKQEARDGIKKAYEYALKIGCKNIHLLAGKTDLSSKCLVTLLDNLKFARDLCETKEIGIFLIQ